MDGPRPARHLKSHELVWFDFDPAWLVELAAKHADRVPGLADRLAACRRGAWACDCYLVLREVEPTRGRHTALLSYWEAEEYLIDIELGDDPVGVEFLHRLPCRSDDGDDLDSSAPSGRAHRWHPLDSARSAFRSLAGAWRRRRLRPPEVISLGPGNRHRASVPDGELTPFESKVLAMLLAPSHPAMDALRAQLDGVRVTSRRVTGAGFDTYLAVAADVPSAQIGGRVTLCDLHAYRDGEPLLGFVLWVRDGRLDCLECFDYVAWPEDFETLDLVAGHAGGNAPTDLEALDAAYVQAR